MYVCVCVCTCAWVLVPLCLYTCVQKVNLSMGMSGRDGIVA